MADLAKFVDRLVEEKGLTGLEPEVLAQVKADLLDRAEDRINAMLLRRMPSEKLEEFEKVINEKSAEEIQNFCAQNISDLEEAVAAELLAFRNTYLGT